MSRAKKANLNGSTWDHTEVEISHDPTLVLEERTLSYLRHPDGRLAKVYLTNKHGKDYDLQIDEGTARALAAVFDQPVREPTVQELLEGLPEED